MIIDSAMSTFLKCTATEVEIVSPRVELDIRPGKTDNSQLQFGLNPRAGIMNITSLFCFL